MLELIAEGTNMRCIYKDSLDTLDKVKGPYQGGPEPEANSHHILKVLCFAQNSKCLLLLCQDFEYIKRNQN